MTRRLRPTGARLAVAAILALVVAGSAAAQPGQPPVQRQGARAAQPAAPGRAARERLNSLVRDRLALTDAQAAQLSTVTERYMRDRDRLVRREREVRLALRTELAPNARPDQERTARLLDDVLRLQSQRLELAAREQRELAAFLTPVQRARFMALQEQMQRTVQQTRQRRAASAPGRPGARPPAP